jgi:ribonuclease P protein component
MLQKAERLTVKEILALSRGISVFSTLISLRYVESKKLKFAVSVSKKIAQSAVSRNRIRRRVYSLLEKAKGDITKSAYIMLMPKKEFLDLPIEDLRTELISLLKKAKLI